MTSSRIVIVLPASENFAPDRAGAIAMVVQRLALAAGATVIGHAVTAPFPGIHYLPVSSRTPAWYNAKILSHLLKTRPTHIEIHQQPRLAALLARLLPQSRIMLFLHNDPLTMRGLRRPAQRTRMLRRLHRVVCVSHYLASRFTTALSDEGRQDFFFKKKKQQTFISLVSQLFHKHGRGKQEFFCFFFCKKRSASLPSPCTVLPNPLTLADLPSHTTPRTPTILFAGRIVETKGIADFIAACATALPQLPGWSATIIGGDRFGPTAPDTLYVTTMRAQAQSTAIGWRGYQPHETVLAAMAQAAIAVVPSRWPEPFGLTALEAMASGAALIATNTGGLPEVAGDAAILIPPHDVAALTQAILTLATDAHARQTLSTAGLARARQFDTPIIAAQLQTLRDAQSPV